MQAKHIILIVSVVIAMIIGPIIAIVIIIETSKQPGVPPSLMTLRVSRNGTPLGSVIGASAFVYSGELYTLIPAIAPATVSQLHRFSPTNLTAPAMTWGINGVVNDFIIQQGLLYYVQNGSIFTVNLPPTSSVTLAGNIWHPNQSVLITDPLNNNLYAQTQTFAAQWPYEATRRMVSTYQSANSIDTNGTLSFTDTNLRTIFSVQHEVNTWTLWSVVWVESATTTITNGVTTS